MLTNNIDWFILVYDREDLAFGFAMMKCNFREIWPAH